MKPLDGVRVLDLSRLLPGPMCSWYLRGLGAAVVKLEQEGVGDYLRHIPPLNAEGRGIWFELLNAGTQSIALDLSAPGAAARVRAVLARGDYDVLIEGFRPGVMARLGLDPAALRRDCPRLIIASISGYGQAGPAAALPGHDIGYLGHTGALSLAARHEGVPDPLPVQVADIAGGALTAALRIAAALYARERTGAGDWLDVSMTAGALALMAPVLGEVAQTGRAPAPGAGVLTGGLPVYRVYRCGDGGLVAVGAIEGKFQAALADGLGLSVPMSEDDLKQAFLAESRDHWAARLGGACVTPVLTPAEALEAAVLRQGGHVVGAGTAARVAPPFPGPHSWLHAPAPALGAHTAELLPSRA